MFGMRAFILTAILCLTSALQPAAAVAALQWHWDDEFSDAERAQLTDWLQTTHTALERYAAPLPFDVHLHLRRSKRGRGPVPWANTWRDPVQALYFYVDTRHGPQAFLDDWTAPHEFSHLLLPYLGRSNAWFAEGFASYLQHSVMAELGVIDAAEAVRRRDLKMRRATTALASERMPLPANQANLRAQRQYPTFYWGGAVYFERVDAALKSQGSSLRTVIADYVDCCRLPAANSLEALVTQLDRVSHSTIFSRELTAMRDTPGCPTRPVS